MKRGTPEHPKMKHLARALHINRCTAVGILECLWHWAGKFAQQGDIGRHLDVDIAEAVYWTREPEVLIKALVECGWVDRSETYRLLIHDWQDHADEAVRKYLERHNLKFRQCRDIVSTQSGPCPQESRPCLPRARALPLPEPLPLPSPEPLPVPTPPAAPETVPLPSKRPTLDEIKLVTAKAGLPDSDADYFFNHWQANGFTNGGKPIKSWQHLIASWKAAGHCPSQKGTTNAPYQRNGRQVVDRNAGTANEGTPDYDVAAIMAKKDARAAAIKAEQTQNALL